MRIVSRLRPRISILLILVLVFLPLTTNHPSTHLVATVNLDCNLQPLGTITTQPNDPEPTIPIWCLDSNSLVTPQATGALDGFGGWIDKFNNTISGAQPAHLNDGEIGYHTYENITGSNQSQHWEANGYFVADMTKGGSENGTDLSPIQSFSFQNGKLILEADVAASEPGFSDSNNGDVVWPEIDWSTIPTPHADSTNDGLYLYGYFRGGYSAGCRLQAHRSLTCSVQADHDLTSTTNDQAPCYSSSPARVMEISGFQSCGSVHAGFSVDFGAAANAWRVCSPGAVDACLDRFRLEWSQNGLVAYLNGIKFAEDSNWPAQALFPDTIVNGSTPIYAHFGEFGDFSSSDVYRFHWGRVAVNPHNPDGTIAGPSASPTFGSVIPTPTPSPTPTPAPTPFSCNLHYSGTGHAGTCLRQANGTILFQAS